MVLEESTASVDNLHAKFEGLFFHLFDEQHQQYFSKQIMPDHHKNLEYPLGFLKMVCQLQYLLSGLIPLQLQHDVRNNL
ncbi:hypothetical protein D3C86_1655810 [compost metagenome]